MASGDRASGDRASGDAATRTAARPSPSVFFAVLGTVVLLVLSMLTSRPEVAAVGLPLALWAAHALRDREPAIGVEIARAAAPDDPWLTDEMVIRSDAEIAEVAVIQGESLRRRVFVPGTSRLRARSRPLHSGPLITVEAAARAIHADGGCLGAPQAPVTMKRTVAPTAAMLPGLPVAPRLTGLHGGHEGSRPGQGGDFRDIHPFAPGDELRRVDWKATARAARRPGELLIRRTNSLSDASAVIVMDTADDLGTVVATWGTGDLHRSGVTSLDHARSAARALAAATISAGDRVAFHTLVHGGRSLRSGAGSRHLARLIAEIAASGRAGDDSRLRRTPPVPHGSIIYVLSTFFDGAAAEIALRWRAMGHRVVAVDTLPDLDVQRLSDERQLALQVLLMERQDMLRGLTESGVETISWAGDAAAQLTTLARTRDRTLARSGR